MADRHVIVLLTAVLFSEVRINYSTQISLMKEKAIGRGHVKSFLDEFQPVADVSNKQKF